MGAASQRRAGLSYSVAIAGRLQLPQRLMNLWFFLVLPDYHCGGKDLLLTTNHIDRSI